jgi:hypothetical protein
MTNLIYSNYLKVKDFNFSENYYADITSKPFKTKENIEELYKRYKKSATFKEVFKGYDLKEIILANTEELKNIVDVIEPRISKLTQRRTKNLYNKIKYLFNYATKYQSSAITPFFTENFDFRTCFYCNKDFITNFESKKKVSTFQLDHFYDKDTYPYLALSFYNLIPSCPTCNSKVKGKANCFKTCEPPNSANFYFNEKVKFKLYLDESCKDLHLKSKDDIDINLKENYSNEYKKYIEVFKLNERYKAHKDIVFDMIEKAELYPESRLKELQDLTDIPFQQIKKDIFNLIDEDADLSKKPFSKLIKDISEELKLI